MKLLNKERLFYLLTAFTLFLTALFFLETKTFNVDNFKSVHTAWKIWKGEKIYVDFDQWHQPTLYLLLAPIIGVLGESINTFLVIFHLTLVPAALLLFITYRITEFLFDQKAASISVIILTSMSIFSLCAFEVRPDMWMLCCELGALYYFYRFIEGLKINDLIYSALLISLAFIFLQKAIFFAFFLGCLMLRAFYLKQISFKHILIFNSAAILLQILFLILLSSVTTLTDYYFFCFNIAKERQILMGGPGNWPMVWEFVSRVEVAAPILLVGYICSTIFLRKSTHALSLSFGVLCLLSQVILLARPYEAYYLPAMPLLAIILSAAISHIPNQRFAYVLIALIAGFGCVNYIKWGLEQHSLRQHVLSKALYVLQQTTADDPVYDGGNAFNLYRKDLDFFWMGGDREVPHYASYQSLRPYDYDIYKKIKLLRPKIISHHFFDTTERPWILWRYRQNKKFEDIYDLIPNRTGYDYWTVFSDQLKTGSYVRPDSFPFNKDGDLEVEMMTGRVKDKDYPYAGVDLRFTFERDSIDYSSAQGVKVTYRLEGETELLLSQLNIKPGNEYRIKLEPAEEYTTQIFLWDMFSLPEWQKVQDPLNNLSFNGLKIIAKNYEETVKLGIRKIEFYYQQ